MYKNLREQTIYDLRQKYPKQFTLKRPFGKFRNRELRYGIQSWRLSLMTTLGIYLILLVASLCLAPLKENNGLDAGFVSSRLNNIAILISISIAGFSMVMGRLHSERFSIFYLHFRESYLFLILYLILSQIALIAVLSRWSAGVDLRILEVYSWLALVGAMAGICLVFVRIVRLTDFRRFYAAIQEEYLFQMRQHFFQFHVINQSKAVLQDFCRCAGINWENYLANLDPADLTNAEIVVQERDKHSLPVVTPKFIANIRLDKVYRKTHKLLNKGYQQTCYHYQLTDSLQFDIFQTTAGTCQTELLNKTVETTSKSHVYSFQENMRAVYDELGQARKEKNDQKVLQLLVLLGVLAENSSDFNEIRLYDHQ